MIRQSHERPEGMDEGTVIMSGLDKKRIIESINVVTKHYENDIIPHIVDDYNVNNVSQKVVKIILSYIDFLLTIRFGEKIHLRKKFKNYKIENTCNISNFYPENFRINDLCLGLKEQGHKVSVLTSKPNYPKGILRYTFLKIDRYLYGYKVYRSPIITRGNACGIRLFINYISFVIFGILRTLLINENLINLGLCTISNNCRVCWCFCISS